MRHIDHLVETLKANVINIGDSGSDMNDVVPLRKAIIIGQEACQMAASASAQMANQGKRLEMASYVAAGLARHHVAHELSIEEVAMKSIEIVDALFEIVVENPL